MMELISGGSMMGLGDVVFSGELFGGLIIGFRWASVMVSFNVIWLLGWACGESWWVCGGFSFRFGTNSGGYMVLIVVLVFFFFGGGSSGSVLVGFLVVIVVVVVGGLGDYGGCFGCCCWLWWWLHCCCDCCCWLSCSSGFGFGGVEKERQGGRVKRGTREEREREREN